MAGMFFLFKTKNIVYYMVVSMFNSTLHDHLKVWLLLGLVTTCVEFGNLGYDIKKHK